MIGRVPARARAHGGLAKTPPKYKLQRSVNSLRRWAGGRTHAQAHTRTSTLNKVTPLCSGRPCAPHTQPTSNYSARLGELIQVSVENATCAFSNLRTSPCALE